MGSKIVHHVWFGGAIGLVVVEDEFNKERRAHIGMGYGDDEPSDLQHIKEMGSVVTLSMLKEVVEHMEKKE